MFKKIYKEANDCIKGDPELLAKILEENEKPHVVKFAPVKHRYIATSLAAVFIVCLSLFVFPEFTHKAVEENINPSVVLQDDSSKEIKAAGKTEAAEEKKEEEQSFSIKNKKIEADDLKSQNQASPIQSAAADEQNTESPVFGTDANVTDITTHEQTVAPAVEEAQNAPAVAIETEDTIPAYDKSDEPASDEEAPMMKSFARASGGGGGSAGGGSSAAAKMPYALHTLPEGYVQAVNSDEMTVYENHGSGAKITSTVYNSETVHDDNIQIGGIHAYREGNCFIITKGGVSYSITFENISEEEIINIIETNF